MKWPWRKKKPMTGFKAIALRALVQSPALDPKQTLIARVEIEALEGENEAFRYELERLNVQCIELAEERRLAATTIQIYAKRIADLEAQLRILDDA